MSQKLPVNYFKWVEDIPKFDESFMKNHSDENDEGYYFQFVAQCPEKLYGLQNDLLYLPERMKNEKVESLTANLMIEQNM